MMFDEKSTFINMACSYQTRMGYKESWIYVIFKKRFGDWPNDLFKQKVPVEPSLEFVEWVNSQRSTDFKKQGEDAFLIEEAKLRALQRLLPRRGKTAIQLARKFGVTERTVQRYTSMPRADYEANSLTRAQPWTALGISRATWYRRGKPEPELQKIGAD